MYHIFNKLFSLFFSTSNTKFFHVYLSIIRKCIVFLTSFSFEIFKATENYIDLFDQNAHINLRQKLE